MTWRASRQAGGPDALSRPSLNRAHGRAVAENFPRCVWPHLNFSRLQPGRIILMKNMYVYIIYNFFFQFPLQKVFPQPELEYRSELEFSSPNLKQQRCEEMSELE